MKGASVVCLVFLALRVTPSSSSTCTTDDTSSSCSTSETTVTSTSSVTLQMTRKYADHTQSPRKASMPTLGGTGHSLLNPRITFNASLVYVFSIDANHQEHTCSGVLVGNNTVITFAHCVVDDAIDVHFEHYIWDRTARQLVFDFRSWENGSMVTFDDLSRSTTKYHPQTLVLLRMSPLQNYTSKRVLSRPIKFAASPSAPVTVLKFTDRQTLQAHAYPSPRGFIEVSRSSLSEDVAKETETGGAILDAHGALVGLLLRQTVDIDDTAHNEVVTKYYGRSIPDTRKSTIVKTLEEWNPILPSQTPAVSTSPRTGDPNVPTVVPAPTTVHPPMPPHQVPVLPPRSYFNISFTLVVLFVLALVGGILYWVNDYLTLAESPFRAVIWLFDTSHSWAIHCWRRARETVYSRFGFAPIYHGPLDDDDVAVGGPAQEMERRDVGAMNTDDGAHSNDGNATEEEGKSEELKEQQSDSVNC